MERSGEEGVPWEGSRVGESPLRSIRSESLSASLSSVPLAAARLSLVAECQVGL